MLLLYHDYGARDFYAVGSKLPLDENRRTKFSAGLLLKKRGNSLAAKLLESTPYEILEASNANGDEFTMLHASVEIDQYEDLRSKKESGTYDIAFSSIAKTIAEIGPYIRLIAIDLLLSDSQNTIGEPSDRCLKKSEIHTLVYKYIGVNTGYLGDFSYQSHHEFYVYLELDINPHEYSGTTRQRFMTIISNSSSYVQARILEGVLKRYPVGSAELRTQERYDEVQRWIIRLKETSPVQPPVLTVTSETVARALADAEQLLKSTGATSSFDRVHTALHGYLRLVCGQTGVTLTADVPMTEIFKALRDTHPAFKDIYPHGEGITKILRAMSTIIDTLNTFRNRASIAHPNDILLDDPEAMLGINAARTVLHYLDAKLHVQKRSEG